MLVVAVLIAAVFLVQRNAHLLTTMQQAEKEYNSGALPANPGPSSEAIREVKKVRHDEYAEINTDDMSKDWADWHKSNGNAMEQAVASYEQGSGGPIEGVYLTKGY